MSSLQTILKGQYDVTDYQRKIAPLDIVSLSETEVVFGSNHEPNITWLNYRARKQFSDIIFGMTGHTVSVRFQVHEVF